MRRVFTSAALGLAVVAMLVGAGSASAASGSPAAFRYEIHLPPGKFLAVDYQGGVEEIASQSLIANSGAISRAIFAGDDFTLGTAIHTGRFSGELKQTLIVTGAELVGVARIPSHSSVTLTNLATGHTITVGEGLFSIPTGLHGAAHGGGTQVVSCRGTAFLCHARVNIAGGASDRKLIVHLPPQNIQLWLDSVTAAPRSVNGSYALSDGHFAQGHSEYVAHLDAVRSDPRGSHLVLTFNSFLPIIY
jgi:hypothetical protein